MEVHEVREVEVTEKNSLKDELVEFIAIYEYCTNSDEFIETEEMIKINDFSFKEAYRLKMKVLSSKASRI